MDSSRNFSQSRPVIAPNLASETMRLSRVLGHPVVTIPVALDRDGLPIGIQIVGPLWSDSRLLAIAKAISAVVEPIGRPPAS